MGEVLQGDTIVNQKGSGYEGLHDRIEMRADLESLEIEWIVDGESQCKHSLAPLAKMKHLIPFIELPSYKDEIILL